MEDNNRRISTTTTIIIMAAAATAPIPKKTTTIERYEAEHRDEMGKGGSEWIGRPQTVQEIRREG